MASYLTPGVYVEEVGSGARPIEGVGTSTAAFIGVAPRADAFVDQPVACNSWTEFTSRFVGDDSASTDLAHAVFGFFVNGGGRCWVLNIGAKGSIAGGGARRSGIDLLEPLDEISIVAAPGYTSPADHEALLAHCEGLRDRVAILDPPADVDDISRLTRVASGAAEDATAEGGGLRPRVTEDGYGALYFPRIIVRDVLDASQLATVPASGHLAGIWARCDAMRGVHKAPANQPIRGAVDVAYRVTEQEQGVLNPNGVNAIRFFSDSGILVWGARTLAKSSSEFRYLNVRRLLVMIEQSIIAGTSWMVFEPNDSKLWMAVRRDVSAFLTGIWRAGALFGETPEQAFFVKCDAETNPPDSIDAGQLVIQIGIAPVKPAEFVIFRIGLSAGATERA